MNRHKSRWISQDWNVDRQQQYSSIDKHFNVGVQTISVNDFTKRNYSFNTFIALISGTWSELFRSQEEPSFNEENQGGVEDFSFNYSEYRARIVTLRNSRIGS